MYRPVDNIDEHLSQSPSWAGAAPAGEQDRQRSSFKYLHASYSDQNGRIRGGWADILGGWSMIAEGASTHLGLCCVQHGCSEPGAQTQTSRGAVELQATEGHTDTQLINK